MELLWCFSGMGKKESPGISSEGVSVLIMSFFLLPQKKETKKGGFWPIAPRAKRS
jgi:hypothetical protein